MFNQYFWGKVRYCEKAENVDVSKFDWFIMEVIVKALGSKEKACGIKSLYSIEGIFTATLSYGF